VAALDPERLYYRGTQRRDLGGVRGAQSWTDAIAVALIWSAVPADPFSSLRERTKARFIETSTVHAAHLAMRNPLVFDQNQGSVGDIMRALRYGEPDGIADDEVRKVFNYLHNRMMGKAAGGEFGYVVYDEDGGEIDPDDRELSFDMSDSLIRDMRDEFEYADEKFEVADCIAADAYVFFDSKTVQAVARRLGFDGFVYWDIFEGCEYAARDLFGDGVDCANIEGIEEKRDVKYDTVFTHRTYRPMMEASVERVWDASALTLLPDVVR